MLARATARGARRGVSCVCLCHQSALRLPHGRIPVKSMSACNAIAFAQRSSFTSKANARISNKTTATTSTTSTTAPAARSSSTTSPQQTRKGHGERANQIKKEQDQGYRPASTSTPTVSATPAPKSKSRRKKKEAARVIAASSESTSLGPQSSTPMELVDYKHSTAPPIEELDRLHALVDKLLATNSPPAKRDIISEHMDQGPLLAWIYDPLRNFYVKSSKLLKYALLRAQQRDEEANSTTSDQGGKGSTDVGGGSLRMSLQQKQEAEARMLALGQGYDHLSGLLLALSTRAISGHKALDAVILFMDRFLTRDRDQHGKENTSHVARTLALFEDPRSKLLLKILDKNLKMGCSINILQDMLPAHLLPGFNVALAQSLGKISDGKDLFPSTPIEATTQGDSWFASRKLDGVRCLVRINRETGGIEIKSKHGKDIGNFEVFQSSFQQRGILPLPENETGAQLRASSQSNGNDSNPLDRFFSLALGLGTNSLQPSGLPDAMILDGEICVFSPASSPSSSSSSSLRSPLSNTAASIATNVAAVVEMGTDNFTKAISFARRGIVLPIGSGDMGDGGQDRGDGNGDGNTDKDENVNKKRRSRYRLGTNESGSAISSATTATTTTTSTDADQISGLDKAMYCVFDCLTEDEFQTRKGTRRLSERIQGLQEALNAFPVQKILPTGGTYSFPKSTFGLDVNVDVQGFVQILTQTELKSFKQLEEMVSRGMELGWEGVMLRKNVGYEGKRSRNLLKIKQFQDAEYVVEEVMLGKMRYFIDGVFQESDQMMTNVVIRHRGNRVRVGSGFSIEDRIRYGKNPKSLLGKTITVQYFEESQTMGPATTGSTPDADVGPDETVVEGQSDKTESNRDGSQEVWSLRFPTVKAIYDKGPRQM